MENNQITFKKHAITNQDDKKAKPIEAAELKEDEVRKYQGVRYLDPTYLMLNYYSGGNIDSYGMVTSLSDPLGKHSVQLEGYYNQGVPSDHSPFSGFATYAYNYANFIFSPSYQKMITESSLRVESFNISERKSFSFGYLAVFDYSNIVL
jgi:hypothetical protein